LTVTVIVHAVVGAGRWCMLRDAGIPLGVPDLTLRTWLDTFAP
jgi:hypothetical protein